MSRPVVLCACRGQIAHQWNIVLSGPGWTVASDHSYSVAPLVDV